MRLNRVALTLAGAIMSGCASSPVLAPTPPGPTQLDVLMLEVSPGSVPEDGPSTYDVRLYLGARNGPIRVDGITLSLAPDDQGATGLECGPLPSALALVVGYPKLIADSSICRAHAPVGTSAKSATLAVNYLDGEGRRKVLRKFAAVVEPCRGECYYSVASSVF